MRSEPVLALLAVGCAFGKEPAPETAAGIVAHLLSDRLVDGAVVLVPPDDVAVPTVSDAGATVVDGVFSVVQTGATTEGALGALGPDGPTVAPAEVAGATIHTLGRVRDTVAFWSCGAGSAVSLLDPGATEARVLTAPVDFCPEALGAGPDGTLLAAVWTVDGPFEVRRYAIDGTALVEQQVSQLPGETATRAYRVGDDGDGPWVLGGTGDLVWSGPTGTAVLPSIGEPTTLVRDGDDVLVTSGGPGTLVRWTPATGDTTTVGTVSEPWTQWEGDLDGTVALATESWTALDGGIWVSAAWWLKPGDGDYAAVELPTSPCHDDEEALDVGEWWPEGVLDTADGRYGVYSVRSWLGPSAVVAAPF